MFFILIIVVGLVAWALHLMQEAVQHKEFSLMLAGFLVSVAAAAMMAVYFLMGHYVGYMSEMAHRAYLSSDLTESIGWSETSGDWIEDWMREVQLEVEQSYAMPTASMFNPGLAPLIQP
jgi:flavorubredoxin